MFSIEIKFYNGAPDPDTFHGLQDLSVIGQYAKAVQEAFLGYVRRYPQSERTAQHMMTRGPLVEAMDEAMDRMRAVRTGPCEVRSYVAPDGHAESILLCQPSPVAAWAAVTFATRVSESDPA
ncbi:MAG TPA: hypothetical protein VFH61_01615 [Thermoleophilia bacterium]|nr:hypothetical protein [Thermoleophilia bacterium]